MAMKKDSNKVQMGLLPGEGLMGIAEVMQRANETKYAPRSWEDVRPASQFIDAALRHIFAFQDGHDFDREDGLSHLDHAGANMAIACHLARKGVDMRDRTPQLEEEAPLCDPEHEPRPASGHGYGYGDGEGEGYGYGYGDGEGDGWGDGNGDGHGEVVTP